jgi:hypothetical protein
MITALIVIASVAAYFGTGFAVAARRRPGMWEKARKAWAAEDNIRGSVKGQFISVVLVWWAYLPIAWLNQGLSGFTAAGDPQELDRRAEEREEQVRVRERHIADLEAENERLRHQQEGISP